MFMCKCQIMYDENGLESAFDGAEIEKKAKNGKQQITRLLGIATYSY